MAGIAATILLARRRSAEPSLATGRHLFPTPLLGGSSGRNPRRACVTLTNAATPPIAAVTRLDFIDATRALAAALVVLVHTALFFPIAPALKPLAAMGQLGVQVFFVASAFTIFASLDRLREMQRPLSNFFVLRFVRIAPLYWLGVALYGMLSVAGLGATMPFVPTLEKYTPLGTLANVLLLHGLYPPAINNVVPGGWSIGAECLFYAAAPLLLICRNHPYRIVFAAVMLVAVAQLLPLLAPYLLHREYPFTNNSPLYYSIFNQGIVFVIGMLFYTHRKRVLSAGLPPLVGALAFSLTMLVALWDGHLLGAMTFSVVPAVAGLATVAGMALLARIERFPAILLTFGQRSFSIYLFHFLVISALRHAADTLDFAPPFILVYGLTLLLTYVVAGISYRAIERPSISWAKRITDRRSATSPTAPATSRSA